MGMNNWGGVTEHMTKKPRTVFANKKLTFKGGLQNQKKITLSESTLKKIMLKKQRQYFVFIAASILIVLGCIYWMG